jgi:hypothetical protein
MRWRSLGGLGLSGWGDEDFAIAPLPSMKEGPDVIVFLPLDVECV